MAGKIVMLLYMIAAVPYSSEMTFPHLDRAEVLSGKPIILSLIQEEEKGGAKALIFVKCSPREAWEKLRDVEAFPSFMPDLEKVEILERKGDSEVVRFTASKLIKFSYVTERHYLPDKLVIWWESADSKFEKNDGFWKIFPFGEGSILLYYVWIKPKFPIPQAVVNYLTKKSLPGMLKSVKSALEGKSASEENIEGRDSIGEGSSPF